jgi:hypothetical protein
MQNRYLLKNLIFCLILISCKKPQSASDLKWGMMSSLNIMSLFEIEPNHSIYVCDTNLTRNDILLNNITSSVQEWARTINRDRGLKIEKGCPPSGPNDGLILVSLPDQSKCGAGGGCASIVTSNAYDFKTIHSIEINPLYANNLDIALHEVGHAWGNCDRYTAGFDPKIHSISPAQGENCDGKNNGDFSKPSAMQVGGDAHPHRVTEDDALGMQTVAQDPAILSYALWQQFFANQGVQR